MGSLNFKDLLTREEDPAVNLHNACKKLESLKIQLDQNEDEINMKTLVAQITSERKVIKTCEDLLRPAADINDGDDTYDVLGWD